MIIYTAVACQVNLPISIAPQLTSTHGNLINNNNPSFAYKTSFTQMQFHLSIFSFCFYTPCSCFLSHSDSPESRDGSVAIGSSVSLGHYQRISVLAN